MRGQRYICLLYRSRNTAPRQDGTSKRYASIRSKGQPYVLSRTVIDLDSNDSKFVRKLEEKEEDADADDEHKFRISKIYRDHMVWERHAHATRNPKLVSLHPISAKYNLFQTTVTSADLISYALLGDPSLSHPSPLQSVWKAKTLRPIFDTRGIFPTDDMDAKVKRLVYGFTADSFSILGGSQVCLDTVRVVLTNIGSIDRGWKMASFHRMVTLLSSTREGCKFLVENSRAITQPIRRGTLGFHKQILTLLNNLTLNMQSKGIQIGEYICNAGLYYAASVGSELSVKQYLEISRNAKYRTNHFTSRAMVRLVRHYEKDVSLGRRRSQLSSLLTGWDQHKPLDGEERRPSFADIIWQGHDDEIADDYVEEKKQSSPSDTISHDLDDDTSDYYQNISGIYLLCLAEMGYKKVLAHEWRRLAGKPINATQALSITGGHMLAFTLLVAEMKKEAISVLTQIAKQMPGLVEIEASVEFKALLTAHYAMHRRPVGSAHAQLRGRGIPRVPEDAIDLFRDLVIETRYPRYAFYHL
jgi:hypothetical protein